MEQQIIKQPNGKYCLFSSVVNNVTHNDMTKEEIVEVWTEEAKKEFKEKAKDIVKKHDQIVEVWTKQFKKDFKKKVNDIVRKLDHGEKPYSQSTLSFVEMLQTILEVHGDIDRLMILKMIL